MYEIELSYGTLDGFTRCFWQQWSAIMPIAELESIVGDSALAYGVDETVFDGLTRRVRSENIPEDDGYNAFIFGRNEASNCSRYTSNSLRDQVAHIGAIYQFFQRFKDNIRLTFRRDYYTFSGISSSHTLSPPTIKPLFSCTNCGRDKYYDYLTFIDSNHCTCNECEVAITRCDICGCNYYGDYCITCFTPTPCYICGEVDTGGLNKRKGEYGVCDIHKHLEPVPEKSYHWKPSVWKYRHMGKN